ncbi:MAG: TadE family protein [Terracidiphilus sp.]|jgi:Flp pilus assembly protein TadG
MSLGLGLRKQAARCSRAVRRMLRLRSEEGSSLVEFAVTLPLLMTVLTGTASFALAFYFFQQLGNATGNAVQYVASDVTLITDPCATAESKITGALPTWTVSKFTFTMVITDNTGTTHTYGPTAGSSFSCTAGATYETQNEPITLTAQYTYSWMPILKFSPSSPLTSTQGAVAGD